MGITGKYHRQSIAGEIIKILVLTVEFSQLPVTNYPLPALTNMMNVQIDINKHYAFL